jgi:hypothetical protein
MRPFVRTVAALLLIALSACSIAQAQQPPTPRALEVKQRVRQVLASHDFDSLRQQNEGMEAFNKWFREQMQKLQNLLSSRRSGMAIPGFGSEILSYLILIVLIVALAYVLAFVLKNLAFGAKGREGKKRLKVANVEELEESGSVDFDEWLAAAQKHAAEGDYRRAYRAVFVALLLRMDRYGAIEYKKSRTNGEYLRALRKNPTLLQLMQPAANAFDARWYGHIPATEADYRSCLTTFEQAAKVLEAPAA